VIKHLLKEEYVGLYYEVPRTINFMVQGAKLQIKRAVMNNCPDII
jgi:hypothetical protein